MPPPSAESWYVALALLPMGPRPSHTIRSGRLASITVQLRWKRRPATFMRWRSLAPGSRSPSGASSSSSWIVTQSPRQLGSASTS